MESYFVVALRVYSMANEKRVVKSNGPIKTALEMVLTYGIHEPNSKLCGIHN